MSYKASVMGRLPFGGAHCGPGDGGGRARGDPDLWDGAGSGGRVQHGPRRPWHTAVEGRRGDLAAVQPGGGSDPASGAF
jgi:hypothetical protein